MHKFEYHHLSLEFKVTNQKKEKEKADKTASSATCLAPDLN